MNLWNKAKYPPKIDPEGIRTKALLVIKDCGEGSVPSYSVGFFMSGRWFLDGAGRDAEELGYRVTHWQSLPDLA
jgi:hypothetical protein